MTPSIAKHVIYNAFGHVSQSKVLPFLLPREWKSWDCYSWTPRSPKLVAMEWHLQHLLTVHRSRRAEAGWAHLRTCTLYPSLNDTLTAIRNYWRSTGGGLWLQQSPWSKHPAAPRQAQGLQIPLWPTRERHSAGSLLTWLPTWIPEFNTRSTAFKSSDWNPLLMHVNSCFCCWKQ